MSNIIQITEMWSKPTSSVSLTDKFRKRSIKLQRAFQILTKPEAIEYDCYKARGLFFPNSSVMPLEGEKFSLDFPYAFADNFSLSRQSLVLWQMNVDYTGELGPGDKEDNPLFTPPRIDWDDVETEEEIDEDWGGKPIQTINGEPIEGVKTLLPDQTVTIKRNMLLFNPFIQARYRRSVNSDSYLGWPPGTAKLMKLSASNVITPELAYWEVTGQIRFRYPYRTTNERAWYRRVRHQGYYKRVDTSNNETQIIRAMKGGEPTNRPVLLNAEGYEIPQGDGQSVEAHWLEFKIYDSLPYGALGLL
jgi:hypothetical protein